MAEEKTNDYNSVKNDDYNGLKDCEKDIIHFLAEQNAIRTLSAWNQQFGIGAMIENNHKEKVLKPKVSKTSRVLKERNVNNNLPVLKERRVNNNLPVLKENLVHDNLPVEKKLVTTNLPVEKKLVNTNLPVISKSKLTNVDVRVKKKILLTSGSIVNYQYNNSNIPKYFAEFVTLKVNKKLKRACKRCDLVYSDLRGFNRHYEKIHLGFNIKE